MGLEEDLQALLASATVVSDTSKEEGKKAGKLRRRSKDLEDSLTEMGKEAELLNSLGNFKDAKEAREIFDTIDDDKNGTLEPHELKAALEKKNGGAMEKIEVYKLLAMAKDIVDKTDEELLVMSDDELKINFDEFCKVMQGSKQVMAELDKDGDGSISAEEIKAVAEKAVAKAEAAA